ncbi:MAG TPA: hypothetical protein VGO11_17325, partial [Chthoniobacteraceae bacterium]|nr:hypothetical protein [Chthoniobacteraceae bacterium]
EATHQVAALQLTSGGLGYLLPPTVTILSPLGSGATGTATVTNGAVTGLTLTNPGARYPKTGVAVLIDHPSEGLTAASGYATMKVSQSGTVTWSGKVGDGTMLSGSGWLKEDHSLALYSVVPYRPGPAGTLSGTVMFDEVPDVSDLRGDLAWSKPPQRGAALYRAGFETTTPLLGSHYLRPAAREQALVFTNAPAGVATFTADDGDLVSAVNDTLSVSNTNIVRKTSTGADRLMLRIVPSTGLFSGTFLGVYPAGTVATKNVSAAFSGVLFQKQNLGEGLVVGPRHTGPVSLAPQ